MIKFCVQTFNMYFVGLPFIIQLNYRCLEWLDWMKKQFKTMYIDGVTVSISCSISSGSFKWKCGWIVENDLKVTN